MGGDHLHRGDGGENDESDGGGGDRRERDSSNCGDRDGDDGENDDDGNDDVGDFGDDGGDASSSSSSSSSSSGPLEGGGGCVVGAMDPFDRSPVHRAPASASTSTTTTRTTTTSPSCIAQMDAASKAGRDGRTEEEERGGGGVAAINPFDRSPTTTTLSSPTCTHEMDDAEDGRDGGTGARGGEAAADIIVLEGGEDGGYSQYSFIDDSSRSDGRRDEDEDDDARPPRDEGKQGWIKDLRETATTNAESSAWDERESLFDDDDIDDEDDDEEDGGGGGGRRTTRFDDDEDGDNKPWDKCSRYLLLPILRRTCRPHTRPPCGARSCGAMSPDRRNMICRVVIIVFMIGTITFTCLDLLILHKYLHVWLDGILAWLGVNPVSGGLAFIGVFVVGSLCFFPVALLSLGAGYAYHDIYGLGFGIFYSFLVCYVGCLLGAVVCFARSRFLMRRLIERFSDKYPIVRAVDRAFETNGFRIFLLLRLSPALPFNALVRWTENPFC